MVKCFCRASLGFPDPHPKRIKYESAVQKNISLFIHKVVARANFFGVTAIQIKEMVELLYEKFLDSSEVSMSEFLIICQNHRPAEVGDDEWERFADTFILECIQAGVQEEDQRQALMRLASCFATSTQIEEESCDSSIGAVVDMSLEQSTLESTLDMPGEGIWNSSDSFEVNVQSHRNNQSCIKLYSGSWDMRTFPAPREMKEVDHHRKNGMNYPPLRLGDIGESSDADQECSPTSPRSECSIEESTTTFCAKGVNETRWTLHTPSRIFKDRQDTLESAFSGSPLSTVRYLKLCSI